jgi:hypothetical protein
MNLNASMFLPILPEILLVGLGAVVLVLEILLFSIPARPEAEPSLVWGGMLRHDWLGFSFTMLFIFGAGITSLLAMDFKKLGHRFQEIGAQGRVLSLNDRFYDWYGSNGFRCRFGNALSRHRNDCDSAVHLSWLFHPG